MVEIVFKHLTLCGAGNVEYCVYVKLDIVGLQLNLKGKICKSGNSVVVKFKH